MARNRTKNEPIGSSPCPFKGCKEIGTVHRYRAQTDDQSRQRRAGKLYMRCPAHGVTSDQEWLLEQATITNKAKPDTVANPAPAAKVAPDVKPAGEGTAAVPPAAPKPVSKPQPKHDDAGDGWGFF